jgi:5-methylcytosine-specific restriction endonuclease McrA
VASGRNVSAEYRRNRLTLLSLSDICWLCGHPGARTADHIVSARDWPRGPDGKHLPGLDALENLAPAHGVAGSRATGSLNRCPEPTCGRLCNTARGARAIVSPRSRAW